MTLNFDKQILNLQGVKMVKEDQTPFTIQDAVGVALIASEKDEKQSAETKWKRYLIAKKVSNKSNDITIEDLNEIKLVSGQFLQTVVYGFVKEYFLEIEKSLNPKK